MARPAQDDMGKARAALQEMEHRRVMACAELTLERSRGLLQSSRHLLARDRELLAQWRSRRSNVRQRLNRPRCGAPSLPTLPKAA